MEKTVISEYLEYKVSSIQGSYWNKKGDYQKEFWLLGEDVSGRGSAKTLPLELFRCVAFLYDSCYKYDWTYNRLSMAETLANHKGKIKPFYKGRLSLDKLIDNIIKVQLVFPDDPLKSPIQRNKENFSKKNIEPYLDDLLDAVIVYNLSFKK